MISFQTVASNKRERQKANKQLKIEQEEKAKAQEQKKRYIFMSVIAAVVLLGGLFFLSTLGDDDDETQAEGTTTTTASQEAAPQGSVSETTQAKAIEKVDPSLCPEIDGSSEKTTTFSEPQPMCIDVDKKYTATIETSLGTIKTALDPKKAPLTVNNFVTLARYHAYDGSNFHRVITDFMIQGGRVDGKESVGYTIAEETPDSGEEYQLGSLVMAKTPGPNGTGSQFFIMSGDKVDLPPEYSLFGETTEGIEVVEAIAALQEPGTEAPSEEITINKVTINES